MCLCVYVFVHVVIVLPLPPPQNKKAVVIYGSQTGTAEEFATRLAKEASRHGLPAMTYDPEECDDWVRGIERDTMERDGGEGWWRGMVERDGGEGMVERDGGEGMVERDGGEGWWRGMVERNVRAGPGTYHQISLLLLIYV